MNLSLRDIRKCFVHGEETVPLFNDFSLTIPQGGTMTIMGPSGSGKTTLLRIIGGLEKPDAGEVLFDDFSLYAHSDEERRALRRKTIGFCDQHAHLLPQLTALENATLPALGLDRDAWDRGKALLSTFGLARRMDFFPHSLSGGERQRVALARAMLLAPPLLLLDEPTASLDAARSDELWALIQSVHRQDRVSVILATHHARALDFFPTSVSLVPERAP